MPKGERKEELPICEATGVDCAWANTFFCSTLNRWRKMGPAQKATHEVIRYGSGNCSLIKRKPEGK